MANGDKPVAKFRLGNVSAAIWENEGFYNIKLSRSYKDGDEWKDTSQLGGGDLMNAVRMLQCAAEYIIHQELE